MKPRDILYLIVGLVVGLIIGAALIGTSDDLRNDLFGSATNNPEDEQALRSSYYQVNFDDARTWLTTALEEDSDEPGEGLEDSLDLVSSLGLASASGDFAQAYADSADDIEAVLNTMRQRILNGEAEDEAPWQFCIGIDNDPYSTTGPQMYLYLVVPEGAEDNLPEEWQENQLDGPREPTLYWSYECYDTPSDE